MSEKLDFQVMATTLMGAINESVSGFLKVKPDKDPVIVTKSLYGEEKFKVSTYGEFIDGSYMSAVYFYHNERDKASKKNCGLMVLYINTSLINDMVGVLDFKNAAAAGEEVTEDVTGELCNMIAGVFRKDLRELGYPSLEMSLPLKFKGFTGGLDYPKGEKDFHRVTSYFLGQTIMMDVILGL